MEVTTKIEALITIINPKRVAKYQFDAENLFREFKTAVELLDWIADYQINREVEFEIKIKIVERI